MRKFNAQRLSVTYAQYLTKDGISSGSPPCGSPKVLSVANRSSKIFESPVMLPSERLMPINDNMFITNNDINIDLFIFNSDVVKSFQFYDE